MLMATAFIIFVTFVVMDRMSLEESGKVMTCLTTTGNHTGKLGQRQGIAHERARRTKGSKPLEHLHWQRIDRLNTYLTLPYNYAPCATRNGGDLSTVHTRSHLK